METWKGAAVKLQQSELETIGARIGVGMAEIAAFLEVEAADSGFDSLGRVKMLFEPHIFYRRCGAANRERAVAAGVAHPVWKPGAYPRDSYPRLLKALQINRAAAFESASWGRAQIMGFNAVAAGFATAERMVEAFAATERSHVAAAVFFIKNNGLADELDLLSELKGATRPQDCVPFVVGYNGPGYAKNHYHIKMAAAHNKYRAVAAGRK